MQKLFLKLSIFDLSICKGNFTINVLKIGLLECTYCFHLFGLHVDNFTIIIHLIGIPIMILRKPKVR